MTNDELKTALKLQNGKANMDNFEKSLRVIQDNQHWGIRLLDSSQKVVGGWLAAGVYFLESLDADKTVWCRLSLSFKQLMSYVLLIAAGQHSHICCLVVSVIKHY